MEKLGLKLRYHLFNFSNSFIGAQCPSSASADAGPAPRTCDAVSRHLVPRAPPEAEGPAGAP